LNSDQIKNLKSATLSKYLLFSVIQSFVFTRNLLFYVEKIEFLKLLDFGQVPSKNIKSQTERKNNKIKTNRCL